MIAAIGTEPSGYTLAPTPGSDAPTISDVRHEHLLSNVSDPIVEEKFRNIFKSREVQYGGPSYDERLVMNPNIKDEDDPLYLSEVFFQSENPPVAGLSLNTDPDGRVAFRVNPIGHSLQVKHDGYLTVKRFFSITGDTQMEIVLQPMSFKN